MKLMLKLFIDFDNTISVGDVGDMLFRRFGGEAADVIDRGYREGAITAKECMRRKCALCSPIDPAELDAFIDGQRIDVSFPEFISFVRNRGIDCTVVSDGLDYYIQRVLRRFNVGSLPVSSNELSLLPVGGPRNVRLIPSFPNDDEECTRCACCKRNVMLSCSGEKDIIAYVGDAYSDQCAVRYADIVFAKPELQAFCQSENISYFEFRSFKDVETRLGGILRRNRLKKRQAAAASRQAFLMAG